MTHEPAIISTGNCLRTLKSRTLTNNRRHKDVLISLKMTKRENEYKNIIHDIGCDPFYVNYRCAEQIHLYRGYCNSTEFPKLVIDATIEYWNRKNKKQRKSSSYLNPNPHY